MTIKTKLIKYIEHYHLQDILTKDIHDHLRIESFSKGALILNANEPTENIYFLIEGKLEISSIMLSGNKIFINNLFPLEIFGDVEYVNHKNTLFDVVAVENSMCIILPFTIIEKFLYKNYHFWKLLAEEGNNKLLKTNNAILLKGSYSLKTVLSNYIIKNNYTIHFNSLSDLALQFNVSYRNLSRIIKELSEEETIQKERKKITTLNKSKLIEYSADI